MAPNKGHPRNKIVTMKSYPLWKDKKFPRKGTEPHVTKPQYEGLDNFHIKHSHSEKYVQDNSHTEL